jgi:KipI family sensor histidine kinase inhibitor
MKWIAYGPHSWMLQFATQAGEKAFRMGRGIAIELERSPPFGLTEYVPAFTSVLLEFHPRCLPDANDLKLLLKRLKGAAGTRLAEAPTKEIPVHYDGPDLGRVAEARKLSLDQLVYYHSAPVYKVYALGFAPGFGYLGDLDRRLHTPRLAKPRPRVPPGSVAIGGSHTGVYPLETPGGWNLIGQTTIRLFDPEVEGIEEGNESAFHLRPGDRVKFVPV